MQRPRDCFVLRRKDRYAADHTFDNPVRDDSKTLDGRGKDIGFPGTSCLFEQLFALLSINEVQGVGGVLEVI